MARGRFADLIQTHRFWLMDVSPSPKPPFTVLGAPLFGFASITAPEYTAEIAEIKQINSMYKRYAYEGGAVNAITLTRGLRIYDSTMWNWMLNGINGSDVPYRNLLLIQYSGIGNGLARSSGIDKVSSMGFPTAMLTGVAFVPARAWLLWNCLPTRCKVAGDMDATSGSVSIMEMDIQPEAFTEIGLGL